MWRTVLPAALLLLAGCGGDENAPVVASVYPLAWAAQRIGGDGMPVRNLTPAGAEPHDLELSPRDVEAVLDADLVLYVSSPGFQPAVVDAVARRAGDSIDAAEDESDPHTWLDPPRFATIVEAIGAAMGRPRAARALATDVRSLDADYRRGLERCERRTVVTTHAAFGQLARRYGLEPITLAGVSPEVEPGPRELERLVNAVKTSGATTVFTEPLLADDVARTVAREAGASVAVLDPLEGLSEERLAHGADYLGVMRENLVALREALGCR